MSALPFTVHTYTRNGWIQVGRSRNRHEAVTWQMPLLQPVLHYIHNHQNRSFLDDSSGAPRQHGCSRPIILFGAPVCPIQSYPVTEEMLMRCYLCSYLHPQSPTTYIVLHPLPSKYNTIYSHDRNCRTYVKSLYRRILKNELDWIIRRDLWRERAIEVRMQFDRNR